MQNKENSFQVGVNEQYKRKVVDSVFKNHKLFFSSIGSLITEIYQFKLVNSLPIFGL